MLIHSASQLLTLAGGPRRGNQLSTSGIIEDGAVLFSGDRILRSAPAVTCLPATRMRNGLTPGQVGHARVDDPHTHLVWAGDRAAEFEFEAVRARTYNGRYGGWRRGSMPRARQRKASIEELYAQTLERALAMFRNGTTTAEAKTGMGWKFTQRSRSWKCCCVLTRGSPGGRPHIYGGSPPSRRSTRVSETAYTRR